MPLRKVAPLRCRGLIGQSAGVCVEHGRFCAGMAPYLSVLIRTHPYYPPVASSRCRGLIGQSAGVLSAFHGCSGRTCRTSPTRPTMRHGSHTLARLLPFCAGMAPYVSVLIRTHPYCPPVTTHTPLACPTLRHGQHTPARLLLFCAGMAPYPSVLPVCCSLADCRGLIGCFFARMQVFSCFFPSESCFFCSYCVYYAANKTGVCK